MYREREIHVHTYIYIYIYIYTHSPSRRVRRISTAGRAAASAIGIVFITERDYYYYHYYCCIVIMIITMIIITVCGTMIAAVLLTMHMILTRPHGSESTSCEQGQSP